MKIIVKNNSYSEIIDGICEYLNKICIDPKTTIDYITKLANLKFYDENIKKIDTVKFICPDNLDIETCFGNIFQVVEFPEILKNGKIKNIEINKVNSSTMETTKSFAVNIEKIIELYQRNQKSLNSNNISFYNNFMFEQFIKLVKDKDSSGL